jgi:phage shock protein PspC (stress-responsive transcriptional regulator)
MAAAPPERQHRAMSTTDLRVLRRSSTDRLIFGVCGGLGRYAGIDPVIFRVAFAVLAFFGGAGVLAYLIAYLLLPAEDETVAPLAALFGRGGRSHSRSTLTTLLLAGLAVIALIALAHSDATAWLALALTALAVVLLLQPGRLGPAAGEPPVEEAPPGPLAPPAEPALDYPPPWYPAPEPVPAPLPRQRSVLGLVTVSALAVVLGVTLALDRGGLLSVSAAGYVATALAVVAAGLLVGARYGRSRSLVVLGVLLTLALAVAGVPGHAFRSGTGDRTWTPASAAEVAGRYRLGAGKAVLDLSRVDFPAAGVHTRVEMGAGQLKVLLPPDVDARLSASVGAGQVDLLGHRDNGLAVDRTVGDDGPDGPGGGSLQLTATIGTGDVEVERAAP